jgi:hypothetical protein
MLSRKYYKMIAKVIKDNTSVDTNKRFKGSRLYKHSLIDDLCYELKKDNNNFNKDTFINACND